MSSATASVANDVMGDPLLAYEAMPLSETFYPLGFPVQIETNHRGIHAAGAMIWPTQSGVERVPALRVRIGVVETGSQVCPPSPLARAQGHVVTIIADQENFVAIDLRDGFAFGWVTTAALHHDDYFRYCILEAAILTLLSGTHVMPLHSACVGFAGRNLLLAGQSGAGKSTLAYACARKGWTYTSDDASYLLLHRETLDVRGHAEQFRFRPAARELFPELQGYEVTPRVMGKPSIEVPSKEFPHVIASPEARVDAMVLLCRHDSPTVELSTLSSEESLQMLEESLFPLPYVRDLQRPAMQRLLRAPAFVLHYRDLDSAIERLRILVEEMASEPGGSDRESQSGRSA